MGCTGISHRISIPSSFRRGIRAVTPARFPSGENCLILHSYKTASDAHSGRPGLLILQVFALLSELSEQELTESRIRVLKNRFLIDCMEFTGLKAVFWIRPDEPEYRSH